MRRHVELSHPIRDGMTTYPGLPAPVIEDHLGRAASRARYAAGTEFQIGRITLVANTGTYVDAPFHRYPGAPDVAGLPLASIADLEGVVVRARGLGREVGERAFDAVEVAGRAVLVETGWSQHFGTPRYAEGHPFLTASAAERLAERGAALVGIDSLNIDDTRGGERPVHSLLLARGIPIVEHLRGLDELPDDGFRFFAVPPPVVGIGSFPVRAFAITDSR